MRTSRKRSVLLMLLACSAVASAVEPAPLPPHAATAEAALVEAEVRKVDKEQRKITLKHGEIHHLKMPPMTMAFKVQDARLLDAVQPGDRVRFAVERHNGALVVTRLVPAK